MNSNEKKPLMGKILVTSGLILKIIQVICIVAGVKVLDGTVATAVTAIVLAGGLVVYSIERKYLETVPLFGILCSVAVVMSVIKTQSTFMPYLAFVLTVVSFGLMLISFGKKSRLMCGNAALIIGGILTVLSLKGSPQGPLVTTVLLCIMYALMTVGIYI